MAESELAQLWKPKWHQRIRLIASLRHRLRSRFFQVLKSISNSDDGRTIAADSIKGLTNGPVRHSLGIRNSRELPYPELGQAPECRNSQAGAGAVFVTARFRSGSTMLWNLFRNVKEVTAYYEPLNERRWFDPEARGKRTDETHRFVDDYWREYDGLESLSEYYTENWISRHLYMDAGFWEPQLRRYIETLIERSPAIPILKFNRVDFRLPWLRKNFPEARVIHLFRHPRNQWCSTLLDVSCFPKTARMKDFAPHDHFYLRMWASDLKYHFPFLDERTVKHPYQLSYYIWKLSYLFGQQYAHHSFSYEDILRDPRERIPELMFAAGVREFPLSRLLPLIEGSRFEPWRAYADDEWFRRQESECEQTLATFFGTVIHARAPRPYTFGSESLPQPVHS